MRDAPRADHNMLTFSKNVVVVDISDPGATDLSFVDLPGMSTITLRKYLSSMHGVKV